MKADKRRFSHKRFTRLVLHILAKSGPMTEAELCSILFQIDMQAYVELGQSITGATYVKGPDFPSPCHL